MRGRAIFRLAVMALAGCSREPATHAPDLAMGVCNASAPPMCSDGKTLQGCRPDGSGYIYTTCPGACADGACGCNPGDTQCNGDEVQRCGMDGQLHVDRTCPPGTCANGDCVPACPEEMGGDPAHTLPLAAWPRHRHDNRNTGVTTAVVADKPSAKWQVQIFTGSGGGIASTAIVALENRIFLAGGGGSLGDLFGLDAGGQILFQATVDINTCRTTPALTGNGTVYLASDAGQAWAIDSKGETLWQQPLGMSSYASPIVTRDGLIVFHSGMDHRVRAFDPTGTLQWTSPPTDTLDSALGESCDGRILGISETGLFALDRTNGKLLWQVAMPMLDRNTGSPMIDTDGTTYFWATDGSGHAIDPQGNEIWSNVIVPDAYSPDTTPLKIGNQLFVALGDGNLHAVDAATGAALWSRPAGGGNDSNGRGGPIADGKHHIYYPGWDGVVYAFDTQGNLLWKLPTIDYPNPDSIIVGNASIGPDGTLYVPGNNHGGELYAFQ